MEIRHDFFKGHVLVLERIEHRRTHAPEQFAETRIAGKITPQREHVQEKSDQLFGFHIWPLRDRGADADVRLAAIAGEQRLEGCEREDEKSHAFLAGEIADLRGKSGGKIAHPHSAALTLPRRARTIPGNRQGRSLAAEPPAPKREMRSHRRVFALPVLPLRIVAVLDGEFGQRIRLAGLNGGVERGEFAREDGARPGIADDVVQIDQQDVLIPAECEERNTDQGKAAQVKRSCAFLGCQRAKFCFTLRRRQVREVRDVNLQPALRVNFLDGISIEFAKRRPPRFVTQDDLVDARLQRADIERATDAVGERNIVRRIAGGDLIHDPHLMLPGGKRRTLARRPPRNPAHFHRRLRSTFQPQFQQPAPFLGKWCLSIHARASVLRRRCFRHPRK